MPGTKHLLFRVDEIVHRAQQTLCRIQPLVYKSRIAHCPDIVVEYSAKRLPDFTRR